MRAIDVDITAKAHAASRTMVGNPSSRTHFKRFVAELTSPQLLDEACS